MWHTERELRVNRILTRFVQTITDHCSSEGAGRICNKQGHLRAELVKELTVCLLSTPCSSPYESDKLL